MNIKSAIYTVLLSGLLLSVFIRCKKEDATSTTLIYGTVADIDGNVYKTVTIGTQEWMAENLKTRKYRNGDWIPNVGQGSDWTELRSSGTYCWYENNESDYKVAYGALYNWYAITDSRNIAPVGWHVPTYDEWTNLINFLGGQNVAGGKLKEAGKAIYDTDPHWMGPNTGGTNSSGFTALPGGVRTPDGQYSVRNTTGCWWTSSGSDSMSWSILLQHWDDYVYYNRSPNLGFHGYTNHGYSVRCVKD